MPEIPKTGLPGAAANRLRYGGSPVSAHPEANLLAAFSEQALTAPERDEVLTHLAQCAVCREIVALSLPPVSEVEPSPATAQHGWFGMRRWTHAEFMRWGVVGASAAVVVAAVLLVRPELQQPESRLAVNVQQRSAPPDAAAETATPRARESAEFGAVAGEKDSALAKERSAGSDDPARSDFRRADSQKDAPAAPGVLAKQASPAAPPPAPFMISGAAAPKAVGGIGAGTGAAVGAQRGKTLDGATAQTPATVPTTTTDSAAKRAETISTQARSESRVVLDGDAGKAKAEPTMTDLRFMAAARNEAAKNEAKADAPAPAKPAESETAVVVMEDKAVVAELQRSADQTSDLSANRNMKALRKASLTAPRTWRVIDGKLQSSRDAGQSWEDVVNVPSGVKVLAVDAGYPVSSSVWVGGAEGVLLRSSDNGATWSRLSGGWTGDVVFIHFSSAKQGVLRTSRPGRSEEWATDDGGLTWKKRWAVGD